MAIAQHLKETMKADVFNGMSEVLFQKAPVDISKENITIAPDFEFPVEVDSQSITEDAPTINHYKIVGMDGDWCSSSTLGDTNISFVVPTHNTEVLKLAYGEDSTGAVNGVTFDGGTYAGSYLNLKNVKVTGSLIFMNDEKNQMIIANNVALWATPKYDNPGTAPFALQFTGTLESGTEAAPSYIFLKKTV